MCTNLTFPTTSSEPFLVKRRFCSARGKTMRKFLMKIWKLLCLNLFFTRRIKMLSRPDDFMLYGQLGVDFFSISELLYPIMKVRLLLIRTKPNFYMIWDPNVGLGIDDCQFTLVVLLSGMTITRIDGTCLLTLLWSSTIWKLLQRLSSFLPDKTSSFKKTFSTMPQFVGLLLQRIQTMHSLDLKMNTHSGINLLVLDKLEHSEEVS